MSRKYYGKPYTQRHIRRLVNQRRASVLQHVNSQLLEYLDLAYEIPSNVLVNHEESNGNDNIIGTYEDTDNINFEVYLNIFANSDKATSLNVNKCSTYQSHELDLCSKRSLHAHNDTLCDVNKMEQGDIIEATKKRKKSNPVTPASIDQLTLLLQNVKDSEESSDDESDTNVVENESENEKDTQFRNSIRSWCFKYVHTIPHMAINDLLRILGEFTDTHFPNDARTLLKTPRVTKLHEMGSGKYCHYGLQRAISIFVLNFIARDIDVDCIELLVNIDGTPLATSSEKGLWIITCSETKLNDVELIGIHHGEDKPTNSNELLEMFVEELKLLINNGFTCNGKIYGIKLHAVICDAPAKTYILNIKYHTGYCSCTKCKKEGEWLNKVCFPGDISTLRTDEDFKNNKYMDEEYQRRPTILNDVPNFGAITNVPLDYMHLVCLGVMLKLIELWMNGGTKVKLSEHQRKTISDRLVYLRNFMPSDFSRKPRQFKNVRRLWKAHELRQFLLYSGPVVMKNDENDKNDESFMLQKSYYNGPILPRYASDKQFQIFRHKSINLNVNDNKNNCVLLKDGSCKMFKFY